MGPRDKVYLKFVFSLQKHFVIVPGKQDGWKDCCWEYICALFDILCNFGHGRVSEYQIYFK